MDAYTTEMRERLVNLREQYDKGVLSPEELSVILMQAIDEEASKPEGEANDAWVEACSNLMAYAERDSLSQYTDGKEQTWRAIHSAIRKEAWKKQGQRAARFVVACLSILFVTFMMRRFTNREWIETAQSPDEQQYIVMGHESSVDMLPSANAGENGLQPEICVTTHFEEVCQFLGYTPVIPTWLPDGWTLEDYSTTRFEEATILSIAYRNDQSEYYLLYDHIETKDVKTLSVRYEQEKAGRAIKLSNGFNVYMTSNEDCLVAVWLDERAVISITGPISDEDIIQMILSIE